MTAGFDIDVRLSRHGRSFEFRFQTGDGLSVVFGPSGAGKTTVLNMITGLVTPDEGQILINGTPIFDAEKAINTPLHARSIGYVPQDLLLFPHMTVEQNLKYGEKQDDPVTFSRCVEMLELGPLLDRLPTQLSGGEGRRLALGRALLSNPSALLLDEPMAGLDPKRRQRLLPFIERIRQDVKIPILYVSHFAEEAARLADDAVMIQNGQAIAYGPADQVFSDPKAEAHFGPFDLGSVLEGQVTGFDGNLALINCQGQIFKVSGNGYQTGSNIRLRILARDIALFLDEPGRTTVQNAIPCTITQLDKRDGSILARLSPDDAKDISLTSMITSQSAKHLDLQTGQNVFAMIKAVAVTRSRHPAN